MKYLTGRFLQLAALVLLPTGLAVGLVEKDIRFEMTVLVLCLVFFYVGKTIQNWKASGDK